MGRINKAKDLKLEMISTLICGKKHERHSTGSTYNEEFSFMAPFIQLDNLQKSQILYEAKVNHRGKLNSLIQ